MRRLRQNRSGIIYILATIITFMFIIGFLAFMLNSVMQPLNAAIMPAAESFHDETWVMDSPLNYASSFMTYFWQFLLLFAMFGLAYWVWMYSQHRGQAY